MLTTFDLDEYAFAALQAGASGFLLKDALPEDLLRRDPGRACGRRGRRAEHDPAAHRAVREAGRCRPPARTVETLTEREREVWLAIARGLTNGEIADALFVSEATVKTHVGNILAKTGMRDRVALVVLAYECGASSAASEVRRRLIPGEEREIHPRADVRRRGRHSVGA